MFVVRIDRCKFDSHRFCDFFYTKSLFERSRKQKIRLDEKKRKRKKLMITNFQFIVQIQQQIAKQRNRKRCELCDNLKHNKKFCKRFHN